MTQLANESCAACQAGVPVLTSAEISIVQDDIPDWDVITVDGVQRFVRAFSFKNFAAALTFANRVGELAEQYNHHPAITVEWGKVTVQWWTHKIGGLHRNDAIMAAKTDALNREGARVDQ